MIADTVWTEKYRPDTLDDVVGHPVAVERLRKYLDPESGGGLPHCLFHGPPGTGKTVLALAFAQDFYGADWQANVREFNASDDRGIDVVRERIKGWCRKAPAGDYPYKIVFLDEADQLTKDAQGALRRPIERYADTTRFVLSCNYPSQIIDPLQSRCSNFHISRLADEEVAAVVERVLEGEDLSADPPVVNKVIRAADGKARDAIKICADAADDGELREDFVDSATGAVDETLLEEVFELAYHGDLDTAKRRLDVEILKAGASVNLLVRSCRRVLNRMDLEPDAYVKCVDLLATIDERVRTGADPHVNFHALLGHVWAAPGLAYGQQGGDD